MPTSYTLETNGNLSGGEAAFGPYTTDTYVKVVNNSASMAYYSVGALAAVIPCTRQSPRTVYTQLTPIAYTTSQTALATDLMNGLITGTHTAGTTQTYTLPTGTLTDTASGLQINQGFEWTLINLSVAAVDTVTIAAGSGHTIVGSAVVQSSHASTGGLYGNAARFFSRKTAANTFVTYRLN
jgi:hypothetical protein